ncbi:MAG: GDSL-type esterase/lipase family protein [Bacteroidia bacterium]|nr:GDSL-type esterase/lipase family protein [Bacteroidia bacterium]
MNILASSAKNVLASILVISFLLIFTSGYSQTKILLIGDSITEAWGESTPQRPTWRRNLDLLLTADGISFDFIGNKTNKFNNKVPTNNDYDWNHEAYWGQKVSYFLANGRMNAWINQPGYDFDIVLMHLGTNNAFDGDPVANTIADLGTLIDLLRTDNPNVTILIAQVIPSSSASRNANIMLLNAEIPVLAANKTNANSEVIVVDQFTGFDPNTDNYDGTHPDDSGVVKMAQKWYDALTNFVFDVSWGDINHVVEEQRLQLNWETLSERNNKGFTVQFKTLDEFEDLGFIQGNGDSESVNSYEFHSGILPEGNYIFRIQQEDFDGQVSYSPQFEVRVDRSLNLSSWAYPNPAKEQIYLEIPEDYRKQLQINFYNLQGSKVLERNFEEASGRERIEFPEGLAEGYYHIELKSSGKRESLLLRIE